MSNNLKSNYDKNREELKLKVDALVSKKETSEVNSGAVSEQSTPEQTLLQTPEMSETEKQARALGWKTKEERLSEGKNNNHFVDADEYVRRQPLFERIDRQSKELRDLKQMNQAIAQHLGSLREEAYNQAALDLESKRIQAINEGDSNKALHIERQIKDTETRQKNDPLIQQRQAVQQQQSTIHPETESFVHRNANWYNVNTTENRRMMEAAHLADRQLAEQAHERDLVLDPVQHLKMVEESVRRNFPHRFEAVKQEVSKKEPSTPITPMVGISTSSKEASKTGTLIGRLTPEQRKIGEHFMRSNPKYTLDAYAKDLERMGRLK